MSDLTAPPVSIDPRIRARRLAVRRDEGRRRLRRLSALAGLVGTVVVAGLLTRSPLLDVDRIEVVGTSRTPAEAVLTAVGIERGDPLTDLELDRARRALLALPWVADAEVHRSWGGTVRIEVAERVPVAAVAAGAQGWALIDADGRVLDVAPGPAAGILPIEGLDAGHLTPGGHVGAEAADVLTVARALPADLVPQLAGLVVAKSGGLELRLAGQGTVRFGPAEEVAAKLLAVRTVLVAVDTACLAVLDVRVPATPVLTRDPACG